MRGPGGCKVATSRPLVTMIQSADALVERRDDAGAGILFGRVGVVQVRAVEPAVPGVDEGRRQLAAVAVL